MQQVVQDLKEGVKADAHEAYDLLVNKVVARIDSHIDAVVDAALAKITAAIPGQVDDALAAVGAPIIKKELHDLLAGVKP